LAYENEEWKKLRTWRTVPKIIAQQMTDGRSDAMNYKIIGKGKREEGLKAGKSFSLIQKVVGARTPQFSAG
jgi:hypothetical protein